MLVRPFIQQINAFNASTQNGVANVCVLGGDIINAVNYEIYQSDTLIYSGAMSVTDNGGSAIRTFQIVLTQSMGLGNNGSYTIRAWTENSTETSGYSSVALFYCYVTPTITLVDSNDTTITSSYVFTAQSGTLTVSFDKNDNNSIATLNTFNMNIFGVDSLGNLNLVYSSGDVYTPFAVAYDNLTPTNTVSPLYDSYRIQWTAQTTQGMSLGGDIGSLGCNYAITETGELISVENDCANGRIKVSFQCLLPDFVNVSNTPFTLTAICADTENIYCGGLNGKFSIYNKDTGIFGDLIETPFTDSIYGTINFVANDFENVYCSDRQGGFAIYNKNDMTFGALIANPFGGSLITSMVVDNDNVYCGANSGKFAIYNKSTGSFGSLVSTPFGSHTISSLVQDEYNIYFCAGASGIGEFAIYNKSLGSFGEMTTFTSNLSCSSIDEQNVYIGGLDGLFIIYNKILSSFNQMETPLGAYAIYAICVDSENVYISSVRDFCFYRKKKNIFSHLYGEVVSPMIYDEGNLYGIIDNELSILEPQNILIRRKDLTDQNSEFVSLFDSKLALSYVGECLLFDYYAKNNTLYEYQITTVSRTDFVQILSQFCQSYIADGDTAYELYENWEVGDFKRNQKSVVYEPYGTKYPFVAYNAVTNYDSGSDTAIYRSPTNVGQQYIDGVAQAKYNKKLLNFLTNRKVKVRKTDSGDIAVVAVLNPVPNTYNSELGNILASTKFEWVEIGDFTEEDFRKLGITNSFTIYKQ